jgi:acyl carrier protein
VTTQQSLISYIADYWLDGDAEGLDSDVPLAELNIIDSSAIFDLVHFLQGEYRITIPLTEVSPANFRTVNSIATLVDRLRSEREGVR